MTIRKLTEREHIITRPTMYIGSVDTNTINDYILVDNSMQYVEVKYVPGLIKIINEIIDNSVDVAIKTNFKYSNEISVKIDSTRVEVKDNGTGIPVEKNAEGHYLPELCWNHARAGSNFDNDDSRTQIGMNGVGSYATACFSNKFVGQTDDGKNRYTITIKDNASSFKESIVPSKEQGTVVTFEPDLEKFGLTTIDEVHHNIIRQRLINLSMSFPDITFKFNGRKINVSSFKKYVAMFNNDFEMFETEDYRFAILPNSDDDFRHFTYVNGLKIPDGGTHVDVIINNIVNRMKDKLAKKYKTIKPGDIRNKLMLIAFMKNVKNTKFNSQSKEKITNSQAEINAYLGDVPYTQIVNKIFKNSAILEPIVEIYKIKEELKRRQELKGLEKTQKRIKCDKYLPSIGTNKYLFLTEGQSALGGLSPVFGRKECGYFTLRGKPLNAYSAPTAKFTANKELSELYRVLKNENYENIVFATDADLDGHHIRGLLIGFFERYMPEFKGKLAMLQTPMIVVKKNGKPIRWSYSLSDSLDLKAGEVSHWMKGLGSWKTSDLQHVVETDGKNKMIDIIEFDDIMIIDDWLSESSADKRKEYILNNDFNIAKI
jgi:DNA gyrase/topoisomerase IV subunit B